ncbi:MAG: hypothetical protein FJX63_07660 [Alphaproteobacteria bacterium]|nr:hypothetical protein [Alphaproteobacteria bacterium]
MRHPLALLLALALSSPVCLAASKDQSRILPGEAATSSETPLDLPGADATPGADQTDLTEPDPDADSDDGLDSGDVSLGEIPEIRSVELTVDTAKRSLDAYALIKSKYAESGLDEADNLQDFVDNDPRGQEFATDIKAAGFTSADEWDVTIRSVSFAYDGVVDDASAEIEQQIKEIDADTQLAKDLKDRMISSLKAMVPSANNRTVISELMKDTSYLEKLKLLGNSGEVNE